MIRVGRMAFVPACAAPCAGGGAGGPVVVSLPGRASDSAGEPRRDWGQFAFVGRGCRHVGNCDRGSDAPCGELSRNTTPKENCHSPGTDYLLTHFENEFHDDAHSYR
jgi:hypothetical protein